MKTIRLHKNTRNWWIFWSVSSVIMTWIAFALIQPLHEEKPEEALWGFLFFYPFVGILWIYTYEFPIFSGLQLNNGYLIINKSLFLPFYRYIRIDTINHIARIKSNLKSANPHHPAPFVPIEMTQFIIVTTDGKRYKTNHLPIDFDSFEKKLFFSQLWKQQSLMKVNCSDNRPTQLRIAIIPLILRCVILCLLLFVFYPWYTYSWYPW